MNLMRVVIATATAGAGHLQAAAALREAWQKLRPGDSVHMVDVLDFMPAFCKRLYADGYLKIIARAPHFLAYAFKRSDNIDLLRKLNRFRRILSDLTERRFIRYLQHARPDILLCPHFLPIQILNDLKDKLSIPRPFVACVVTDFSAHAFWIEPGVDLFCVAAGETKKSLLRRGVSKNKIAVTGIPVGSGFRMHSNKASIKKKFGIDKRIPVILLLSGGFGVGPVENVLKFLDRMPDSMYVVVVTGKNNALRRELESRSWLHRIRILGYVRNMNELMAVSSVIITKPGGLTVSEALASGKPMLLLPPIPGQEIPNSKYLVKHGAAIQIKKLKRLPVQLRFLLKKNTLHSMTCAAKALGQPEAARSICQKVLSRVRARNDKMQEDTWNK